jgi:ubiquinone/menaquinone biosynthesis C-methylase UbiE
MRDRAKIAGPGEVGDGRAQYLGLVSGMAKPRFLSELAAFARIDEIGGQMAGKDVSHAPAATERLNEHEAAARSMWALGDYHTFAKHTVWGLGPTLVEACAIAPGQRVLDVAAGTGNVAIRAAEAGATVVASDLTPENFEAGRREAREREVELEWVEADAESLPFGDGEFDVVASSMGAMFAQDHQAVADELVRVCRPSGTIGMINFTPEGIAAEFFETFARHAPPPPPGSQPPILWGSEQHVRELFGDRVEALELTRHEYVERSPGGPQDYCDFFKTTFGPVVALYGLLADQPDRLAALDREFLDFATRANRGTSTAAEYHYEYLLIVARKRA